jgi:uncharacterized SAM-binding protein YcdF (DUF218 family)
MAMVSSDFHLMRAMGIARQLTGMPVAAPTPWPRVSTPGCANTLPCQQFGAGRGVKAGRACGDFFNNWRPVLNRKAQAAINKEYS